MHNSKTYLNPEVDALKRLSRWGRAAFATRVARIALHLCDYFEDRIRKDLVSAVERCETAVGSGVAVGIEAALGRAIVATEIGRLGDNYLRIATDRASSSSESESFGRDTIVNASAHQAASAIAQACISVLLAAGSIETATFESAIATHQHAIAASAILPSHDSYALLCESARHPTRHEFDPNVFSLYAEFDIGASIRGRTIVELRPIITDQIISELAQQPKRLFELEPREFEFLIARVFEGYGFEVAITPCSRDSGRDIIAIRNDPVKQRYLIECKRYATENRVGLSIVQRLHGVVQGEDATMGLLATTSSFTDPAFEFLNRPNVRYRIDGRDFEGVHRWLVEFDQMRTGGKAVSENRIVAGGSYPVNLHESGDEEAIIINRVTVMRRSVQIALAERCALRVVPLLRHLPMEIRSSLEDVVDRIANPLGRTMNLRDPGIKAVEAASAIVNGLIEAQKTLAFVQAHQSVCEHIGSTAFSLVDDLVKATGWRALNDEVFFESCEHIEVSVSKLKCCAIAARIIVGYIMAFRTRSVPERERYVRDLISNLLNVSRDQRVKEALMSDINKAKTSSATRSRRVVQFEFGPMWPDGAPNEWAEEFGGKAS